MNKAERDTLVEIVGEAMHLPKDEREAFVRNSCADAAMREEAMSLMESLDAEVGFMASPTMSGHSSMTAAGERPGDMIGRYRLLEQIGEGGFGLVFMAEQQEPVRRRVALKIIKLGMDTGRVITRFEAERQALAMMDHPNIARVLDAGATETGRPYFVMDLVQGEPITVFCDAHELSVAQRLELFTQVCRAVQHAHSKGIIHRDLKPGNVLVAERDGRYEPKVIDFGIAKAIDRPLTERTLFTEFRQFIGTPEYMSPEQAGGAPDVDTRTDVYALGVMLYELLTGTPPLDRQRLRSAAFDEMQRLIREEDAPPPSTRLSRSGASLSRLAAKRHTEPSHLGTLVRGELDWIVMRSLEKDRARRYESPGDFARDVERFLAGEPVEAAPASRAYRARKLVSKHRIGFAASLAVATAMIAATWVSLWQAGAADRQRNAARQAAEQATLARDEANQRRAELEQVVGFQQSLLRGVNLGQMGLRLREDLLTSAEEGMRRAHRTDAETQRRRAALADLFRDINFADASRRTLDGTILARGLAEVRSRFARQPLVKAELLKAIGDTMVDLGLLDEAGGALEEAVSVFSSEAGADSPQTLYTRSVLAHLRFLQARSAEAEQILRDAHDRALRTAGPDAEVTLDMLQNLGRVLRERGSMAEAEQDLRQVIEQRRRLRLDELKTLDAIVNLADLQLMKGSFATAEQTLRPALDVSSDRLGKNDERTILILADIGAALRGQDRNEEAAAILREALRGSRATLGSNDPKTLQILLDLGAVLRDLDQEDDAEAVLREALDASRRMVGDSHPRVQYARMSLADLLIKAKHWTEAESLLRQAVSGFEASDGPDSPMATITRLSLGRALTGLGRYQEAESAFLQVQRAMHDDMNNAAWLAINFADMYDAWDKAEPGRGHDAQAADWRKRLPPDDAPDEAQSQPK